jgi:hypothetical protein
MLPPGWVGIPASNAWDGTGAPSHEGPFVDQLVGAAAPVAWVNAAPYARDLVSYRTERPQADAAEHPCPALPESDDPITIDGQPAALQSKHCPADGGILVMEALIVYRGTGFVFAFQDPSNDRAAEPADRSFFVSLLNSVRLKH